MKVIFYSLIAILGFGSVLNAETLKRVPANLSDISLQCSTPEGFAGLSAEVSGTLRLSALPSGAAKATGSLKVKLLNRQAPWSGKKTFIGQYDDLTSVGSDRYFHGGATIKNQDDLMSLYVSFNKPNASYVEYSGSVYKIFCK